MTPVPLDKLEALAAMAPQAPPRQQRKHGRGGQPFNLDSWMVQYGLVVKLEKPWNGGGRILLLEKCPFNPDHQDGSAAVTQAADGILGFTCHHNSCDGKGWRELRILLEPDAYKGGFVSAFSPNGHHGPKGPVPPIVLTEDLPPAPQQFVLDCLNQQEYGDAQLLAWLYPDRLVYDHAGKHWYEWGGHFWKPDKTARVRRLIAGQLAAQYLILSAELGKELEAVEAADEEATGADTKARTDKANKLKAQVKSLRERATELRQLRRVQRILDFAGSFLGVVGTEWDQKPGLLACPNGVIDLRTGVPSPGDPCDYIRSASPTKWHGLDAPCPRFEQFILEVFDETNSENPEVGSYIQEAIGYAITGTVFEHILLIFFGPGGRNGKDTLLETIGYVLGPDVAAPCSADVFVDRERKGSAGGASEHLYDLMGKRLVWGSESDEDARLNGNQIKFITGGGQIICRPLWGHLVNFPPTHTAVLLTNFRPRVPDYDDALWERVQLVGFPLRFVDNPKIDNERQKDPLLKDKLKSEAPGIQAWVVRGSMRWYAKGRLVAPDGVRLATKAYKDEMNPLADFIADCCIFDSRVSIANADLWKGYQAWVGENAVSRPIGRKTFSQRVGALQGVTKSHNGRARFWVGIDLAKVGPPED
jgi:putative DNA primase/helicase